LLDYQNVILASSWGCVGLNKEFYVVNE
jgi:hypothetical protein